MLLANDPLTSSYSSVRCAIGAYIVNIIEEGLKVTQQTRFTRHVSSPYTSELNEQYLAQHLAP